MASDHGGGQMLRLRAAADESLSVDQPEVPVTPGTDYVLEVAAGIPAESAGSAYVGVIWVASAELDRERLFLTPQPIALDGATTDALGNATFAQQLTLDAGPYLLRLDYAGSADHWPAYVEQPIEVR